MKTKIKFLVAAVVLTVCFGTTARGQLQMYDGNVNYTYSTHDCWTNSTPDNVGYEYGSGWSSNGIYIAVPFLIPNTNNTFLVFGYASGIQGSDNEVPIKHYKDESTYIGQHPSTSQYIYRLSVPNYSSSQGGEDWRGKKIKIWVTNGSSSAAIYINNLLIHPTIMSPSNDQNNNSNRCSNSTVSGTVWSNTSSSISVLKYKVVDYYDLSNETNPNSGYTNINFTSQMNGRYSFSFQPSNVTTVKLIMI